MQIGKRATKKEKSKHESNKPYKGKMGSSFLKMRQKWKRESRFVGDLMQRQGLKCFIKKVYKYGQGGSVCLEISAF